MRHPRDRVAHTTTFGTPVVEHWLEREMARSDDPCMYEGMLLGISVIENIAGVCET